jgi:prolyl oligopeptidase
MRLRPVLLAAALALCCHAAWAQSEPDKFLWLEDVNSPRALDWVRSQNAPTLARLQADPRYRTDYDIALTLAQDPDRIPIPQFIGGMVYNLWQDADHVQGIFRRTTLDSYRTAAPHWTTVLDLDALSRQEGHRWVFKAITCWQPEERRCLISLSDGGEDAVTTREYDMQLNRFVDGGFTLPRSKMVVAWLDGDTILAATDWGPGSLTHSGYPFIVKKLQRRQPLSAATTYFTAQSTDVGVRLESFSDGAGRNAVIIERELDFFRLETLLADPTQPTPLPLPQKLTVDGLTHGHLIVTLNEAFSTAGRMVPAGSIAALDLDHSSAPLQPIFTPGPRQSVDTAAFLSVTSFLQPTSLYLADLATTDAPEKLKSLPARFDAAHEAVDQHEATSSDGTKIPYFVVHPQNMAADGINPTLLYAYGGFQISMTPTNNATLGRLWLEHGGVYVLANIRGGGEFGPAWHEAGLKTHRQRIYDDFAAVARDLIATHITSPAHLGIRGGSNGGLLMGVEFTQHPELYKAVIIDVPLLDMLRYEQIAAGASWVGEYGTVSDPTQRAFLASISPYNNLRLGVAYPEPFIFTTTKDDRVGPVHARKFAARLAELHRPYLYYEAIEGGHAAGANLKEKAQQQALEMTYLAEQLGVK